MGTSIDQKTIILGDEYDDKLREVVLRTLRDLGATPKDKSWAVGGSQELEKLEVEVGGNVITVEAETFVGLSIRGKPELVQRIAGLVGQRMADPAK